MADKHRILLIEDCEGDIDLITNALEETGFDGEINSIRDGEDAFEYLMPNKIDDRPPLPSLIILDINIPKISGIELLDALKRTHHTKGIPTVILTSSAREQDINRCYEHHASAYFVKPASYAELVELISAISTTWLKLAKLKLG
ncbi:MAG: response regulator [Alteromonadaceae bacterium]|nr:response regulator [Alteromonadaceae bacterium]